MLRRAPQFSVRRALQQSRSRSARSLDSRATDRAGASRGERAVGERGDLVLAQTRVAGPEQTARRSCVARDRAPWATLIANHAHCRSRPNPGTRPQPPHDPFGRPATRRRAIGLATEQQQHPASMAASSAIALAHRYRSVLPAAWGYVCASSTSPAEPVHDAVGIENHSLAEAHRVQDPASHSTEAWIATSSRARRAKRGTPRPYDWGRGS